jgi:hypothetical protein
MNHVEHQGVTYPWLFPFILMDECNLHKFSCRVLALNWNHLLISSPYDFLNVAIHGTSTR